MHRVSHVWLLVNSMSSACLAKLKMREQKANKFALYRIYIPHWPACFYQSALADMDDCDRTWTNSPCKAHYYITKVLMRSRIMLKWNDLGQLYSSSVALNHDFENCSCNPLQSVFCIDSWMFSLATYVVYAIKKRDVSDWLKHWKHKVEVIQRCRKLLLM